MVLPELLALAVLALAVVFPALSRGELIGRGEMTHEYSLYAFVAREIRMGRLPLWNPYTVAGNPGLADPASNVFYPLTVPLLTLGSVTAALDAMVVLHLVLAGAFMLLYLGSLRLSRPAGFAGAAAYMLSGVAAWRILSGDIPRLATYACVPLLFYLVEEIACGRQRLGAALLGGVVLACPLLAGETQNFTYLSVAVAAYAGFRVAALARDRLCGTHLRRAALCLAAMFVLGAGFASIQALPTLENFAVSNRPGTGTGFALLGSIPPVGLVSLFAPRFFGDEIHGWWGEAELGAREFYPHAASLHTGFFTVVLAIAALVTRRDRWHVRFFALFAGAVLWLALGKFGYLYRAVALVPFLRNFRDIENINLLLPMSVSVLAAVGLERYLEPGHSPEVWRNVERALAVAVGAGVVLAASTILSPWRMGPALLSLPVVRHAAVDSAVFVAVAWAGSAFLIRSRAARRTAPAWLAAAAIAFLLAGALYAAAPLIAAGTDARPIAQADAITRYLGRDRSLYRVSGFYDRGPIFGVQDTGGEPSLLLARYQEYSDALQGRPPDASERPEGPHGVAIHAGFDSPLLDLLNVKYVILRGADIQTARLEDPSRLDQVAPDILIYRRPHVFPRVLAAGGYRVIRGRSAILHELNRPGYDPRAFVVLERRPALPPGFAAWGGLPARGGAAGLPPLVGLPARARITSYTDTRVEITAEFPRPGFLVLNDIYYPAWQAELDGRPAPVYRANYLVRAVAVPAGRHVVRFEYRDRMLALGRTIALLAGLCGLAAWVVDRTRRDGPSETP
ncbi:MAG TPA: hypothetical protein VGZ23_10670 [bacterium]|nr:hypothetical protein [bacterium]